MFEEGPAQILSMPNPSGRLVDLPSHLSQMVGTKVGHIRVGNIGPEVLYRIVLWSVGWKKFRRQPCALFGQIPFRFATAMRHQPIPQQNEASPFETPVHRRQKCLDLRTLDRSGMDPQGQAYTSAERGGDQHSDRRKLFPVEVLDQDGRFPFRRPSSTHRRLLRKAAFVQKPYKSTQFFCFFLIRGHFCRIQRRMSTSSLSLARRAGRWQVHPNLANNFHTCPG